jgi:hypothetical protein
MNEWLTGLVRGEPEWLFKGQCVMNVEDILGSEASESSLKHIQKTNVQGGQTPDGVIKSEQRYDNFQHIVHFSQNEGSAISHYLRCRRTVYLCIPGFHCAWSFILSRLLFTGLLFRIPHFLIQTL